MNRGQTWKVAITRSPSRKENVFAIGGPSDRAIAFRVPGKPLRDAAIRVDDVDVGRARDLGRVSDAASVGREVGAGSDGSFGGKPLGLAAVARSGPDVPGIEEGYFVFADRRILQQQRTSSERRCAGSKADGQQQEQARELTRHRRLREEVKGGIPACEVRNLPQSKRRFDCIRV